MHCTIKTKCPSWKIWHIILCTLTFGLATGAVLLFLLDVGTFTILPMIILPFPTLLIKLFMQDKMKYSDYILIIPGFAASIIAADLLVYFLLEYGRDTMYFIL